MWPRQVVISLLLLSVGQCEGQITPTLDPLSSLCAEGSPENATSKEVTCLPDTTAQAAHSPTPRPKTLTDTRGFKIGLYIHLSWFPVIIPLGYVGNILSMAVLLQRKNRAISCCVYMLALALCDTGVVMLASSYYIKSIEFLYFTKIDMNYLPPNDSECQLTTWMFQWFSLTGVFIIISMTVDRMIGVRFPFVAMRICTASRARKVALCIPILTGVYTIPYLMYSKYVGPSCVAMAHDSRVVAIYSWVTICLNCFFPFVSILSMNTIIIYTIVKSKKNPMLQQGGGKQEPSTIAMEGAENSKSEKKGSSSSSRENQLIVTLLLVSFTFLVLTLPLYIRYILYQYVDHRSSVEAAGTFQMIYHITNKMFYTNNSINFILYCIGGSKFRQDVRDLFRCGRKGSRGKSGTSSSGTASQASMNTHV